MLLTLKSYWYNAYCTIGPVIHLQSKDAGRGGRKLKPRLWCLFYFYILFSIMLQRLQLGTDAAEDIWKNVCTWMETEVQPDSGLWVFVVTWRWRQDLASIFNPGSAEDGYCCHCRYHMFESCVEFSFNQPLNPLWSASLKVSTYTRWVHVFLSLLLSCSVVTPLFLQAAVLFTLHTRDSAW